MDNKIIVAALGIAFCGIVSAERVAILDLGLKPDGCGPFGCPSDPAVFERVLGKTYETFRVDGEAIAKSNSLADADLLVVPTGTAFPASGQDELVRFLASGGKMLTCGGYAFDRPVIRNSRGEWVTVGCGENPIPDCTRPVVLPPASKWRVSRSGEKVVALKGPDGSDGISFRTPFMKMWSVAETACPSFTGTALSVWLKDDGKTPYLEIELVENDGSRWCAITSMATTWKEYRFSQCDFRLKGDSPKPADGRTKEVVRFENVRRIKFCITMAIVPDESPYAFSVAGMKTGDDPWVEMRAMKTPWINTRMGTFKDAIYPRPDQIGVFDASYELSDVASGRLSDVMKGILPPVNLTGDLKGFSALGPLGVNGHGFDANRCVWRPILDCHDAKGSLRGRAGAFLRHHSGTFAGSDWAIFGVSNRDLFANGSPLAEQLLPAIVRKLLNDCYLHDTAPDYACWKRGETRTVKTFVRNSSKKARKGTVRLTLSDEKGKVVKSAECPFDVAPGTSSAIEVPVAVTADMPDFLKLSAELVSEGNVCDREASGVVVWTPELVAKGPKVRREGLRLTIDGESRFFLGAQPFWGQYKSSTASSPLYFDEVLKKMRASGLRWMRGFLHCRDEQEYRVMDAFLQLAAKHGIVVYQCLMNSNTADPKVLSEQCARAKAVAERYRLAPHLVIDITNEPTLRLTPTVKDLRQGAMAQCAWARVNAEAFHSVLPDVQVSIGHSQGWGSPWLLKRRAMKDPPLVSMELDFTDQHYYRDMNKFIPTIKDVDVRVFGKPLIVGECGARCHPSYHTLEAFNKWDNFDTEDSYCVRFRYFLSHAFGNGCTAQIVWIWQDPMEGIFPFGLLHADGVPRKAFAVFTAMCRAFGRLETVDNPPDTVVVIDESARFDEKRRVSTIADAQAVSSALEWWGANFSTVTSSQVGNLPKTVKCVIRPNELTVSDRRIMRRQVGTLLRASRAGFTRQATDPETLKTFRVPGRGATGWVFWNGGETPVRVGRGGASLTVRPDHVGYVQIGDSGKIEVCEEL